MYFKKPVRSSETWKKFIKKYLAILSERKLYFSTSLLAENKTFNVICFRFHRKL